MSDPFADPDLRACAQIVERGDPDRFAATMAAPVAARARLFPLYAFNVEVARAPWVTQEPMIAEMRLQWWADALDEIARGASVRRHEVATPLARVIDEDGAAILGRVVAARRRDAWKQGFESAADWRGYLDETGGALMWAATRALGQADDRDAERRAVAVGGTLGLANYLLAVPELLSRGVRPLPEMSEREFAEVLDGALAVPGTGRPTRAQRTAELAAWRARGILARARRDPAAIVEGRLEEAPARRRLMLLWRGLGL